MIRDHAGRSSGVEFAGSRISFPGSPLPHPAGETPATSAAIGAEVSIFRRERMAVLAVSPCPIVRRHELRSDLGAQSAPIVDLLRNRLQVERVDTTRIAAQMIDHQSVRDRPDDVFVGYAMGAPHLAVDPKTAVVRTLVTHPEPASGTAWSCDDDAGPKPAFVSRQHQVTRHNFDRHGETPS